MYFNPHFQFIVSIKLKLLFFRLTIETLSQLATSTIAYGAWGNQNKKFFLESVDETSQIIGNKLEEMNDPNKAASVLFYLTKKLVLDCNIHNCIVD